MKISDILLPDAIVLNSRVTSKKRALEVASEHLTLVAPTLDQQALFKELLNRERLGSTAIGEGIALPHCRMAQITHPVGAFIQLHTPIDFNALDNQLVNMLFVLVVPLEATEEHLQILAALAELFSNESIRNQLHTAKEKQTILQLFTA